LCLNWISILAVCDEPDHATSAPPYRDITLWRSLAVGLELPILALIPGSGNVAWHPASDYPDSRMKDLLLTLLHLAVVTAKLCGPGGVRAVIAENLVLKQQLIVLRRARKRAPNLALSDRLLWGFRSLFLRPGRLRKVAITLRPSTLLAFHRALVRCKYRRLFSSTRRPKKPGPKGPDESLIQAIGELNSRIPGSAVHGLRGSSRRRSASTSTRTS
jgi:hypothetical protein